MIYISSSCLKNDKINQSVEQLAIEGYKNIELSGGTNLYEGYIDDLLKLKEKYNLRYLLHNYFPPPREAFMLNIASLDNELFEKSIKHCLKAIEVCKILGSNKYGVHAGFLIDFSPSEAGKKISLKRVNNRSSAIERLGQAWKEIKEEAGDKVDLYIENNVFSKINHDTYKGNNPFLLTDYNSYLEILNKVNFKILLDLAHLKVSCNTLNLDFVTQSNQLIQDTDYLHVSGNDGLSDQNHGINEDENILNFLKNKSLSDKTLTIEVYSGLDSIRSSYEKIKNFQNKNNKKYL
jgi:sugar phosphate isomerase/epimerase